MVGPACAPVRPQSASQPVDPDPCGQRENDERQEFHDAERCDLECRGVQKDDGHERQREAAHLAADHAAVGGKIAIDLLDAILDLRIDFRPAGEIGVRGIGDAVALGP